MGGLRSDRRIKLLFLGVGARPWIRERRDGHARGIYDCLEEDDRFSGKQILKEVQWRLNALILSGGIPAYQLAFGSNPADKDEDMTFAQDTSISGQYVRQWKLRMLAQEAALQVIGVASYGVRQVWQAVFWPTVDVASYWRTTSPSPARTSV